MIWTRSILVALALVALAGIATGSTVLEVDDEHQLTKESSIEEFESTGSTSTSLVQVDMSLTVAESSEDVGLKGVSYTDFDTTYIKVEYREEISRRVRIHLPAEYFRPRPKESLKAVESDVEAELRPVDGRNYTALTITVDGPTTAVFEISKQAGVLFGGRAGAKELMENNTGVDVPSVRSSGQWSYVSTSELENNTTVAIDTRGQPLTLQYDTEPAGNKSSWLKVPTCGDESAPVCRFTRDGEEDRVFLLARSTDVPDIRYKHGNDRLAGVKSALSDASNAVDGLLERASGFLDWI